MYGQQQQNAPAYGYGEPKTFNRSCDDSADMKYQARRPLSNTQARLTGSPRAATNNLLPTTHPNLR